MWSSPATRFTYTSAGSEARSSTGGAGGRLRILHCLRAPVGGLFRHVCDVAREQAARGHDVGVVCDLASGDRLTEQRLAALARHLTLGLERAPMSREIGPRDIAAYLAIRAYALARRIDVMHGHGAKGGAYSRLVAASLKRAGRQVVSCYTPHGGSLHYAPSSLHGRLYMGLERRLARHTDALIFESAYAKARYEAQVGRPTCATCIVPNGLAPDEFKTVCTGSEAADFLFIGELRHLKGVDVMLRALARVRAVRPVRAIIVGEGPDAKGLARTAAELGITGIAELRGAMPAREAFKLARALVVPSRAESLPYIVLEAAAAGVPLLATNVGGIPEIVDGTDATLLPAGDDVALAAAMLEALEHPAAARARALRLREVVAQRFTLAAMTDGVLRTYASVAG